MAGQTLEQVKQVFHDVKTSWYFRFWALLWIVGVIVTLVSFGVMVGTDRRVNENWFEFQHQIDFPNFHFRVDFASQRYFTGMSCNDSNGPISFYPCDNAQRDGDITRCRAIHPTTPAVASFRDHGQRQISCFFTTNGTGPEGDIMAYELEGHDVFSETDGGGDTATWFGPNSMLWLTMKKRVFEWKNIKISAWDTVPIYHSTLHVPQQYNVTVMIGEFLVQYIQPREMFSGWVVYGAIGGTAFFMVMIQTIVMIALGICFANTSTFLSEGRAGNIAN